MFTLLKKLLQTGIPTEILKAHNLRIIDVRTSAEFASGHIHGSINIPLKIIEAGVREIDNGPIVLCCASGARSAIAHRLLQSNGLTQVYNGGSWTSLQRELEKLE